MNLAILVCVPHERLRPSDRDRQKYHQWWGWSSPWKQPCLGKLVGIELYLPMATEVSCRSWKLGKA